MKKTVFLLASLFVMMLATQRVNAQNPATASANATATIITPITIAFQEHLNFGNIVAGTDAGTVTVTASTTPARSSTRGVILPIATPGTFNAARFTVSGLADATYTITLPASATITHTDGATTMTVDEFTSDPDEAGVLTGGTQDLSVGARLNVGAGQVAGDYTGEFSVTVAYN